MANDIEEGSGDYLVLVDRAVADQQRPREFKHGRVRVFKAGQKEMVVPRETAIWVLTHDQQKVWTVDGEYTCRFGIKECPDDVLAELAGQNSIEPITIDTERAEGWEIYRSVPVKLVRIQEDRMALRERQGSAPGVGMGKGA